MSNNSTNLRLFVAAAAMCMAAVVQASPESVTADSDGWMLTDALGRKARSYDDAGDRNTQRFVGMFYWTWHQGYDFQEGNDDTNVEVKNITEVLREYPDAIKNYNHPAWGEGAKRPSVFYWDEPLFGYYKTTDPWVLRKHAEMLADAGIDCIFMDCTNGSFVWEYSYRALLQTWDQAQKDGVNVPKIVFLLPFSASDDSKVSIINLYKNLYSKGEYENLWFYWDGKPLIMAYDSNLGVTDLEKEILDFFTFRPGQPDYVNGQSVFNQWGWLEVYPTHGYNKDKTTGEYEQCTVGIAQNARYVSGGHCCAFTLPSTYGRSYSKLNGFDKRTDAYLYGANFQEQWDRAINELKPKMVFVTGWNEWTSGMWNSSHGWSDPLSFVDQYDWDHSRDIEPTKGWGDKGDVYYQQLVDNVRNFKGMSKPDEVSDPKTITLGAEGQWDDVLPRYKAYKGNTFHRDHAGRYNKYYTNYTGRNDITGAQVTHDADYVYFRVETAENLTPDTDPNWMMLYIDIDRDRTTGWNGYDFIVNRNTPEDGKVSVERCIASLYKWIPKGTADYSVNGNVLEIAVPKTLIRIEDNVDFEFKWSDNLQTPDDIMDFYVSGDCAPGGRFNYHYHSDYYVTSIDETTVGETLTVTAEPGCRISVSGAGQFSVISSSGVTVGQGCGDAVVDVPCPGVYIVVSAGEAAKILVK